VFTNLLFAVLLAYNMQENEIKKEIEGHDHPQRGWDQGAKPRGMQIDNFSKNLSSLIINFKFIS
jgi:hypothetical protein